MSAGTRTQLPPANSSYLWPFHTPARPWQAMPRIRVLPDATCTHTHADTRSWAHTPTHTQTHRHVHAHTHTHTQTHTHHLCLSDYLLTSPVHTTSLFFFNFILAIHIQGFNAHLCLEPSPIDPHWNVDNQLATLQFSHPWLYQLQVLPDEVFQWSL